MNYLSMDEKDLETNFKIFSKEKEEFDLINSKISLWKVIASIIVIVDLVIPAFIIFLMILFPSAFFIAFGISFIAVGLTFFNSFFFSYLNEVKEKIEYFLQKINKFLALKRNEVDRKNFLIYYKLLKEKESLDNYIQKGVI